MTERIGIVMLPMERIRLAAEHVAGLPPGWCVRLPAGPGPALRQDHPPPASLRFIR